MSDAVTATTPSTPDTSVNSDDTNPTSNETSTTASANSSSAATLQEEVSTHMRRFRFLPGAAQELQNRSLRTRIVAGAAALAALGAGVAAYNARLRRQKSLRSRVRSFFR